MTAPAVTKPEAFGDNVVIFFFSIFFSKMATSDRVIFFLDIHLKSYKIYSYESTIILII